MARSLISKTQLSPNIVDLVGQYGSGFFVPIRSGVANVVFRTGSQLISGVKIYNDLNIFSGGAIIINNRSWATGINMSSTISGYQINYSGGNFPTAPRVFTQLEITGSNIFNYNIRNRTVSGFEFFVSNPLNQSGTLNIMAVL